MDLGLQGKVAIVTGASKGIGKAIAQELAQEGVHVILCARGQALLEEAALAIRQQTDTQVLAVPADLSSLEGVQALVRRTREHFGTVDILVNNAARVPNSPAEESRRNLHYQYMTTPTPRQSLGIVASLSDDDWLKWWGVNMHGVFYCTRAALRLMEPRRSGKIINIASIAGLSAMSTHSPGYSATKAGVINLTKTTALDVAGANIFVNAIACGGVLTPPFEDYLARATDEQKNRLVQMVPLGRIGRPEEYASLAVYLASDEHYLVGQVISPNGGMVI